MKVITFGRSDNNDVIINDPFVGRNHCQIVQDGDRLIVVDLNSTNGTFVNGTRITGQHPLSLSDEIRIGQTTLNWQPYFTTPASEPSIQHQPGHQPAEEPQKKSGKTRIIVAACLVLLLAIAGVAALLMPKSGDGYAAALPENMMALMSVNLQTLQKQTGINRSDVSRFVNKLEREILNNKVDLSNSGIRFSAPVYAFVEEMDLRSGNVTCGVVVPLSDRRKFGAFLLDLLDDQSLELKKHNTVQYISEDNVFIGFDNDRCLCYVSTFGNKYQLANTGYDLLTQDAGHSGKRSKLFGSLTDDPVSGVVSGSKCERVLSDMDEFSEIFRSMGVSLKNTYPAVRLAARDKGLEISLNTVDGKSILKNTAFRAIKGTKLADFPADDMFFAAINANGDILLREILASLPLYMRADVDQIFEEANRENIDIEGFLRAINGDMYLSLRSWDFISYQKPEFAFMAQMPSANELNNSVRSVQNLISQDSDLRRMFNGVEKDNGFLCLRTARAYQARPQFSQKQYQNDMKDKFIYASVNVDKLSDVLDGNSDFREITPYLQFLKRVSASASDKELSLKVEMEKSWQYLLNNL